MVICTEYCPGCVSKANVIVPLGNYSNDDLHVQ